MVLPAFVAGIAECANRNRSEGALVAQSFTLSVSLEIVPSRDDFLCERKRLFPKNFPVLNFPVSEIMLQLRLARVAPYRGFSIRGRRIFQKIAFFLLKQSRALGRLPRLQ
jgi:hypothetical protein